MRVLLIFFFSHLVRHVSIFNLHLFGGYDSLTIVKILKGGFKCLCTTCCLGKSVVRQDYSQTSEFIPVDFLLST